MSRKIYRVPVDFDWPLNQVWKGFLMPDKFDEDACPAGCKGGYSWQYNRLHDLWYGYGRTPFYPAMTGSVPLTPTTPVVRAFAERNVRNSPEFYGYGERAIEREGRRLADMWNQQWCHHLSQTDVDALLEADRLWDFTREVIPGKGWQPKKNLVHPTAAQVNEWTIRTMGHDSVNSYIVVAARCERYRMPVLCSSCDGHGSLEAFPGQRAEAEAWEPTDPPAGEGWQLWETVSEGSPISPVCPSADALADWMSQPDRGRHSVPWDVARRFIDVGWAPTMVVNPRTGLQPGVEAVGAQDSEKGG